MAGYIGSQTPVVSNGSQRKYTFTATAAQTVFTGMDIPNPQQIQVFQNGVRLVITTDYTVSSGTTVTLVNAASAGDSLVVILFADYQLLDTDALTFTGGTTIEGGLTVDNDGATVLTVDRATSDGTIIDVQKDGTTVGSIGTTSSDLTIDGPSEHTGLRFEAANITPRHNGAASNGFNDLGTSSARFKDLYLSGGVYLGGTGAANKLDDYEEGTWTPVIQGAGTNGSYTYTGFGAYTKIGRMVTVFVSLDGITQVSAGSGYMQIAGLPFTKKANCMATGAVDYRSLELGGSNTDCVVEFITSGSTNIVYLRGKADNYVGIDVQIGGITSGSTFIGFSISYEV